METNLCVVSVNMRNSITYFFQNWDVARILRDIIMVIRYIFDQLFFMPCGVTCQVRNKEVPINDRTWRFRYSLYYVWIEVYTDIFYGSYEFSRYFL